MAAKVEKKEKPTSLPSNKRMNELDKFIASQAKSGDGINAIFDQLILNPVPGLIAEHAPLFAKHMHEIKVAAWKDNNKLAKKYAGPEERRADATYIRKAIAFSLTGATKQWHMICALTSAYTFRANIAGDAAKVYKAKGAMPNNKWFADAVAACIKKTNTNNNSTSKRKASQYLERIKDACEKMQKHYKSFESDGVVLMLRTAKAALKAALADEKKSADKAKAALKAALADEKKSADKAK